MTEENQIEQEVTRRVANMQHNFDNEMNEKNNTIADLTNHLLQMQKALFRLEDTPYLFGTVVSADNLPDASRFQTQDRVVVVQEGPFSGQAGVICSNDPVVSETGTVMVELSNGMSREFSIGTQSPAEVHLADKPDGTKVVVSIDGKPLEVRGAPELELNYGDPVRILESTKQIVSKCGNEFMVGPIVHVEAITAEGIEVNDKGEKKLVLNPSNIEIEEGDRVCIDSGSHVILRKLAQDPRNRYKLNPEVSVSWDEIGGLEEAKKQCQEAIELPFQQPELFEHYGMKPPRGILMFGPPGCGKTMMARAMATAIAKIHNQTEVGTGYIYVKSPEILDKWVGNSEAEIRNLFERGRKHYREHGYKALLVFDEFDAIAPQRGSRRSSDIADTIVPMFLGEMDGVDTVQTKENPIVVMMTNRPDTLDPAVIRDRRVTSHIRVGRPSPETAVQILKIHTKDVPIASDDLNVMFAIACQTIFSKAKLLYTINGEYNFTFGDCVNGAMLEGICERAKLNAIYRDIKAGTRSGVTLDDFTEAIDQIYQAQQGLNHAYDLADFAEKHGIQPEKMQVERQFGSC